MKKIYMLNNSQGVIGLFLGLKSRISPMNHRLWTVIAPMLFVAFGLFGVNEKAWADYTTTLTSNGGLATGPYEVTENNVKFTISSGKDGFDSNGLTDYYFIHSGKTGNVSWSSTGYNVRVKGVSIYARNDRYGGTWGTKYTAKGYIYTSNSNYDSKTFVCQNKDYSTYAFSNSNAPTHFPSTGLGDDGKIYFYAESDEFQIKSLTFTYTTTAKSYTISLNDNGGAGGDGEHNVTYNTATGSLTKTPTKKGYHFTGYYLGEGGTGTKVFNADKTPVQNVEGYTDNSNNKLWKHDGDVTLYAGWEANTYTVHFDGNHASGGSTADQGFTYNEAEKALRANGYTYAYTITYDANGGSCSPTTENTNASCTFDSWNTNPNGTGTKYTNQEPVQNLTDVNTGTVYLYAQWTSGATLPTASLTGKKLVGWYDGETFVGTAGQTYQPTANVTLTAHWQDKLTPQFTFAGQALQLGGTYTSFSFSNTTTATPSSSTSDKFHYIITEQTVEGDATGTPNPGKVITFDGTTITAVNKGTAKIKFVQLEDTENDIIAKESEEYVFTVTKFTPEFTWTPQTYYFNKTYANIFSSNNHDTEISCSTTNSGAAEMVDGSNSYQKTLKTYNDASATITISQAENYYWEPKTVNNYAVSNSKASNHVAFTINNSAVRDSLYKGKSSKGTISCSDDGLLQLSQGGPAWTANALYYTIELSGIPDKISFIYRQTMSIATAIGPTGKAFVIYESPTGADNTWNEVWSSNGVKGDDDNHDVDPQSLSASTRFIKFYFDATYTGQYKNITVTELQYFRRQGENTTLDFATNVKNQEPAVQSFVVEHANAGYQTSVTAPEHYLVSKDNVNFASEVVYSTNETAVTGGDKMGTFTVYVKYLADAIGTHNANVTVHNNLRTDFNVPVTGTTKDKIATQIEYCGASSYSVDAANIASTTLFRVRDIDNDTIVNISGVGISLSCAENDQFSIVGGNALDPKCGGTNNVKPSFAGNDTYAAATNNNANFAITITRLADEINFDNARSTLVVGDEIDLSGWASAESESEITYEVMSSDQLTGSIKIENGKLIALSAGTVRIKATSEGNCLYNSGYDFHNMKVRNPGDPCGSLLLDKSATVKCGITAKTSESPQEYAISAGPMDELKFKIWRVATAGDQVTIRFVDKDGNAVPNGTYTYSAGSLGTSKPDNYTVIDVSNITGATKLQIYGGGLLNKYVSNVQITQKAYLTTYVGSTQLEPTASVTMPEVKACNTSTKDITIKYSDLTPIQLSHTNDVFTYEIYKGENKVGFFDNDCRGFGTYTVRCICTPTSKGEYSDVLTLTASGQSQTINLSLNANAPDRTIVWTGVDESNVVSATQTKTMTVQANTACLENAGTVYFTAIPADAVTIDGHNVTFNKSGLASVKLVAHTNPSDDYNDADTVYTWWNVGKVGLRIKTIDEVLKFPTITKTITYGDGALTAGDWNNDYIVEDTLNYEIVGGEIDYISPTSFIAAGPAELKFHFRPTNYDVYSDFDFYVPVTVRRATTTASANDIVLTYGETPDSKTLTTAGDALEGTWSWNDDRSDDILNASADAYALNVTFTPDNNNYAPYETTVNVTVNKATPAATVENVSCEYGTKAEDVELVGTGVGEWSWTDSRKGETLAVDTYEMDVHFAPTDDANYNAIDTKITLTVNKIETLNVPVALSFCKGGSVSYRGETYTEAGTDEIEAVGATRDTVYNVTITELQPTTGTDSKTITLGDEETWNDIDLSVYAVGEHSVEAVLTNAVGCDSTVTLTLTVNAPATYVFEGEGNWENDDANWNTGENPTEPVDVTVNGNVIISTNVVVSSLTITDGSTVSVVNNGSLTVNGASDTGVSGYGDLYIRNGGEVEVPGSLIVRDLIVEASIGTSEGNAESGQVASAENIVYTNAYIDINMDPSGFMDDTKWYGFTVPFAVDAHNGVSRLEGTTYRQCGYGVHYMIAEYDANKRLNTGNGWKYISGNTLNAGQFYFFTVGDGSYNTYRFKASGSSYTPAAAASLNVNGPTTNYDANWNGVGNSTLQHVTASYYGGEYVQVFMNGQDAYKTVSTNDANFVVGCPFFIQAKEATTLLLSGKNTLVDKYYAPRRAQEESTDVVRINLSATDGGYSDQIYFCAADKEQDAYIIGQDLSKAGVSDMVPQLWMAQYNQKLSVHEAAWNGDQATCPLGIYVPKSGEFVLTATQPEEGTQIYLTENGAPIWDLTMSEYVLSLEKGNTSAYGLKVVRAPQVTTGVDETEASDKAVRKVIIDNTMYIITPEGTMFNVIGKKVQ